jgi:nucleoside-diphosphate-sugar epimerase
MNALQAAAVRRWVDKHSAQQPVDWRGLQGARLLLTGCTGPFGLWILHRISQACARGELEVGETVVLSRSPERVGALLKHLHGACQARALVSDIRDLQPGQVSPTHVIHGATTNASETFAGADPEEKFATLVDGTRSLIRSLELQPPRSLVFLSSGIAYGTGCSSPNEESSGSAPMTTDVAASLGHAKRAAEFLLSSAGQRWKSRVRIARCFSFCGPGIPMNLHYALGDFIRQALQSDEIRLASEGKAVRSYLHLADMATAVLAMLGTDERSTDGTPIAEIVNIGSDRALSIRSLAEMVARTLNPNASIVIGQSGDGNRSGNRHRDYLPDTRRLGRWLVPSRTIPLQEAIMQMAEFESLARAN